MNKGLKMKKFLCVFMLALITALPCAAQTQEAEAFAKKLADEIMSQVVLAKTPLKEKQDAFRRVFLEATDIDLIARFTLGRYARTISEDQRQTYVKVFTDNVIYTWTERFSNYAGEKIIFQSSRQEDGKDVYVTSKIDIPNTENDIAIIWRITTKNNSLKLVDLVVEGVSMVMSYRNEYTTVLQQNGGDIEKLIETLKKKNTELKNPSSVKK